MTYASPLLDFPAFPAIFEVCGSGYRGRTITNEGGCAMTVKGHVENNVVIFDEDVTLADGTNVVISIDETTPPASNDFWKRVDAFNVRAPEGYTFNRDELYDA